MSAVSTVFDALDRAAPGAPPAENAAAGSPPGASSDAAGVSSSSPASASPTGSAAGVTRLPKDLGGDAGGLKRTIESRVYNEERHVVDINVALPPGTRVRRKGDAHGVTIHTGYGTAQP